MSLLHQIIEGEQLKEKFHTVDVLEISALIVQWKVGVEQSVNELIQPYAVEDRQRIEALLLLVDDLNALLALAKKDIQTKQQQLVKSVAVAHAYMESS